MFSIHLLSHLYTTLTTPITAFFLYKHQTTLMSLYKSMFSLFFWGFFFISFFAGITKTLGWVWLLFVVRNAGYGGGRSHPAWSISWVEDFCALNLGFRESVCVSRRGALSHLFMLFCFSTLQGREDTSSVTFAVIPCVRDVSREERTVRERILWVSSREKDVQTKWLGRDWCDMKLEN